MVSYTLDGNHEAQGICLGPEIRLSSVKNAVLIEICRRRVAKVQLLQMIFRNSDAAAHHA